MPGDDVEKVVESVTGSDTAACSSKQVEVPKDAPVVDEETLKAMLEAGKIAYEAEEYEQSHELFEEAVANAQKLYTDVGHEMPQYLYWYGSAMLKQYVQNSRALDGMDGEMQGEEESEDDEEEDEQAGPSGVANAGGEKDEVAAAGVEKEEVNGGEKSAEEGEKSSDAAEAGNEEKDTAVNGDADGKIDEAEGDDGEDDDESVGEDDEDDVLGKIWYTFEAARSISLKKIEAGEATAADERLLAAIHNKLSTTAAENSDFDTAIEEQIKCVELEKKLAGEDASFSRAVSSEVYMLALIYIAAAQFDNAKQSLIDANEILLRIISRIEEENKKASGEVKEAQNEELVELRELVASISERIDDMASEKAQYEVTQSMYREKVNTAMKDMLSGLVSSFPEAAGQAASGSFSADDAKMAGGSERKVEDISHLVRRKADVEAAKEKEQLVKNGESKRKVEETVQEDAADAKKLKIDGEVNNNEATVENA